MSQPQESPQKLSGPERGEMYVAKFQAYLSMLQSTGQKLPVDEAGQPVIIQISRDSEIPRNSFYTNKGLRRLLYEFVGVDSGGTSESSTTVHYQEQLDSRDRRILQLEQRVANLEAEKEELRRRLAEAERTLARYEIIENEVVKSGRRIIP